MSAFSRLIMHEAMIRSALASASELLPHSTAHHRVPDRSIATDNGNGSSPDEGTARATATETKRDAARAPNDE